MSYIYVGERYQCLISMSANIINVLFCLKGNCRGTPRVPQAVGYGPTNLD
jgi:hypothetical protein